MIDDIPAPATRIPADLAELDAAQQAASGDMDPERFRRAAHAAVDLVADYLAGVERFPILPRIEPGAFREALPVDPPLEPEPLANLLADVPRLVEPNATHWQHPGFMAYFATSAAAPGILGEIFTAALGQNPMLWRTSPVGTELEEVVVGWLRRAFGLPDAFDGLLTDTASTSSLIALAAAREAAGFDASARGLAARPEIGRPVVYASTEAHASIDRACMTLGLGRTAVHHVSTDAAYAMDVADLEDAIRTDRADGARPIAIVATIGTTSSTAIDPVARIADVAAREGCWLHMDSAYAGATAILPDRRGPFAGWDRADSIVVNPHKWLFTPLDASLLLSRRMDQLRAAFSLVPEYLRTLDRARPVHDYSEYQPQLGRRMRALKLWFEIRYFGVSGLQRRLAGHIDEAAAFASWVDADPDFERLAPVPFSTICLRWRPAELAGREAEAAVAAHLDAANEALMAAVNDSGDVFLSHTKLGGRFTIRVSIGNLRTEHRHVERCWELLRTEASKLERAPVHG